VSRKPAELARLSQAVSTHPILAAVLDAVGIGALVVNRERELVFANEELLRLVGTGALDSVVGRLLGDVLGCVNADGSTCGESAACQGCPANEVLLSSRGTGGPTAADCMLTVSRGRGVEALELRVKAAPLALEGERFTVVTLRDISAERGREALERVFFHDVLNTITGLYGHIRLLEEDLGAPEVPEIVARVARICDRLRREVQDQRSLLEAETGRLRPELRQVHPGAILDTVAGFFAGHVAVSGKELQVVADDRPDLVTDPALLTRVLINMVKNAFEASRPGDRIRLRCHVEDGRCVFSVHNPGVIPEEAAVQIFRRSFSTKGGRGRGLGTYSMKLFGERYLGGRVGFNTSSGAGTEFFISLPLEPDAADPPPP